MQYAWLKAVILRAARNESGERSGVSPPIPRFRTGKLTHAARQFSHSRARGVYFRQTLQIPGMKPLSGMSAELSDESRHSLF